MAMGVLIVLEGKGPVPITLRRATRSAVLSSSTISGRTLVRGYDDVGVVIPPSRA
ncbi:hypothetical protein FHU39_002716 [Flexivirga oryzae]|uniref:Uncharacterized protein n=1 Tax=Flexivirga oryzae TaxID=1794944 RepID=A0A839N4N4_9MICO|nr:hypothetical protein [Flexivirga oryzae]